MPIDMACHFFNHIKLYIYKTIYICLSPRYLNIEYLELNCPNNRQSQHFLQKKKNWGKKSQVSYSPPPNPVLKINKKLRPKKGWIFYSLFHFFEYNGDAEALMKQKKKKKKEHSFISQISFRSRIYVAFPVI